MVAPDPLPQSHDAITILPLGAIIQTFKVGGHNIVQGFATAEQYRSHNAPYFGETIGRLANRVSNATIKNLNGRSYELEKNNGPNSLHGGPKGWGKCDFKHVGKEQRDGKEAQKYVLLSPDGDEGFPGQVEARVWYTQWQDSAPGGGERVNLGIEYEVEMTGDDGVEETCVGVTNHSYFNIAPGPSLAGTEITLATTDHLPTDAHDIPHGNIAPFPNLTANKAFTLGPAEPKIDHCFILNTDPKSVSLDTRGGELKVLVHAHAPETKLHFEALSTEPAFQFYTGEYIDVPAVGELPAREKRSGFCVEPSRYVDAVNNEDWKAMVTLKRGQKWGSKVVYRAWKE